MKKSFILLLLLPYNHLSAKEDDFAVLSLGVRCLPAAQIYKHGLKMASYPFDSNDTSFEALLNILENKFEGFCKRENIKVQPFQMRLYDGTIQTRTFIIETKYNIALRHDFSKKENIDKEYETVRQKYERRINRFYETLASGKHIYFIRHIISKEEAITLTRFLDKKFPTLHYTLVAVGHADEIKTNWNIPKVKNFYLGKPSEDWATIVADAENNWRKLFTYLNLPHRYELPINDPLDVNDDLIEHTQSCYL